MVVSLSRVDYYAEYRLAPARDFWCHDGNRAAYDPKKKQICNTQTEKTGTHTPFIFLIRSGLDGKL